MKRSIWVVGLLAVVGLAWLGQGASLAFDSPISPLPPSPTATPVRCPAWKWCEAPEWGEGVMTLCWWNGGQWVRANFVEDPWLHQCQYLAPEWSDPTPTALPTRVKSEPKAPLPTATATATLEPTATPFPTLTATPKLRLQENANEEGGKPW